METNSFFDMNRFKYVLLRQISINYKTMLIASGAIIGIMILIGTTNLFISHQTGEFFNLFMPIFLIGGFIFTSIIFSELNSPHRGYLYLTLPASAFEKLIVAWLVSSLFYIILVALIFFLHNVYLILIAAAFALPHVQMLNLFSPGVLKVFGFYMVFQSIFFLGAIYFRRVNFLKTLLAGFILVVVFSIYSGILAKIMFNHFSIDRINVNRSLNFKHTAENVIVPIAKYLFWCGVGPFFLTVSYFRLKERQV